MRRVEACLGCQGSYNYVADRETTHIIVACARANFSIGFLLNVYETDRIPLRDDVHNGCAETCFIREWIGSETK